MKDPFCTNGISKHVYWESEYFYAALNIKQYVLGQSLIIPKRHIESILEFKKEEESDLFLVLRTVIPNLLRYYSYKTDSYNLIIQRGKYAGMSINHLHIHIIPRNREDVFQFEDNGIYKSFTTRKKQKINTVMEGEEVSKETERLRIFFERIK